MGLKAVSTSAASLDTQPVTMKRKYRGIVYKFRELDAIAYDKVEKEATSDGPVGLDGTPAQIIDPVHRGRRLLQETCVSPRMSLEQIARLPFRLANTLQRDMNELYFSFDAAEKIDDEEADDDTEGEG